MMLMAMLLATALDGYEANTPITCVFPSHAPQQKSIRIVLEPKPSLKDQPGLYRVMMDFEGQVTVRASAQPILTTQDDDILIRGHVKAKTMYSIGLRADGMAAFNIQDLKQGDASDKRTRIGECRGHEAHVDRWLSS